ncbi:MAG: hypothetical protein GY830_02065 [Bacteroidetes bacterium]|nr:hypothetical protein [Bacteroidota bacterium]
MDNKGIAEDILYCDHYLKLLKKYTGSRVSVFKQDQIKVNLDLFFAKLQKLNFYFNVIGFYKARKSMFNQEINEVRKFIEASDNFYKLARKRDEILVQNMLKFLDRHNQDFGVLVSGWFHNKGITRVLEMLGISYEVVVASPSQDYDKAQEVYRRRIQEESFFLANKKDINRIFTNALAISRLDNNRLSANIIKSGIALHGKGEIEKKDFNKLEESMAQHLPEILLSSSDEIKSIIEEEESFSYKEVISEKLKDFKNGVIEYAPPDGYDDGL